MEKITKRLTIAELSPEERTQYDNRLLFLIGDGYPLETARSICLDGILSRRGVNLYGGDHA